jgi:hypothetical protein
VAAGVGLTAALAIGVPAAAGQFTARTGELGKGGEEGTAERVRLDAPDIGNVYEEYTSKRELPPGGTWDAFLARMSKVDAGSAVVSEDVVAQWVAWEARCQWERAWLRDEPAAQGALEDMTTWREFTEFDAGGVGTELFRRLVDTARDGDATLLEQDLKANCS